MVGLQWNFTLLNWLVYISLYFLTGIYFFVLSAVNLAALSSTCNSPRFNSSVKFLIGLLLSHSSKIFSNFSLISVLLLQQKWPMHYVGQYLDRLKVFSVRSHMASYLCIRKFSVKNFPQKRCGAKLVTVTNQPVSRLPPSSYAYCQAKKIYPQPVESIDGCRYGWNFIRNNIP